MLDVEKFIAGLHGYLAREFEPLIKRVETIENRAPVPGPPGEKEVRSLLEGEMGRWALEFERRAQDTLQKAVDRIPRPKDGEDGKSVTVEEVRSLFEGELQRAVDRIPRPKDGENGKSVTIEEVRSLFEGELQRAVDRIPRPKDGENGKSVTVEEVRSLFEGELQRAVDRIPRPKDGENGKSVTIEEVRSLFEGELQRAVDRIPRPKDGENGKSVTVEEVRSLFEGEIAKWALEFERRAQDTIQKTIDRIPAPTPGKDGIDGLGFDDLEIIQTGERGMVLRFSRDGRTKEFFLSFPVLIERGTYKPDSQYEKGDGVTYAGSFWICQKDHPKSKPGEDGDWRLAVKRGRDAKGDL